jgi:hypothetical protein
VSAKYIDKAPSLSVSYEFGGWLSEDELFHGDDTDIFMGKVLSIKNIRVDFDGIMMYYAIAKIRVDRIYRWYGIVGRTVSVLLPCPVDTNERLDDRISMWVEDTEVVSSMRTGMTGIFMLIKYDKTMYWESNGARLYFRDLAEYGFPDGVRYAFLDSGSGLIFARFAYESISSASSLEEIEKYIIKMIE